MPEDQISAEIQTRVRKWLPALKAFGIRLEAEITEATASFFCDTLVEMELGLMIEVVGFNQYVVPGAFSTNYVLAAHSLIVEELVVHDGDSCGCLPDSCYPIIGSDHKLIIFKIGILSSVDDVGNVPWPHVRHWPPIIRHLQPQLLQWAQKLVHLRQGQSPAPDERRAALDILYAEFVTMVWQAAEPFISHRPAGNQRPQPDWWDDECYQQLVSRNAAWRKWRRERTANAREAFCRKRLQFPPFRPS